MTTIYIRVSPIVNSLTAMRVFEHQCKKSATFVDFASQMQQLRLIKSNEEIMFLRKGAEFSDLAIEALEHEARPGITEHELASIVESAYLGLGRMNSLRFYINTSQYQRKHSGLLL
jgi:Xaa-Pro aminopeptidase